MGGEGAKTPSRQTAKPNYVSASFLRLRIRIRQGEVVADLKNRIRKHRAFRRRHPGVGRDDLDLMLCKKDRWLYLVTDEVLSDETPMVSTGIKDIRDLVLVLRSGPVAPSATNVTQAPAPRFVKTVEIQFLLQRFLDATK